MKDQAIALATASAATGSAAAWGVGEYLGVPGPSLVAGLVGAVAFTLLLRPKTTKPSIGYFIALASAVLGSTLTAGFLGPFSAALLGALIPTMATVPTDVTMKAISFMWGAGAQILLKTAIEAARKRIEQIGGASP